MVPLSRRAVLGIGAASLPLAGCLGTADETATSSTRPATASPETSDEVPDDVTLANPEVHRMVIADLGIWGDLRHWSGQFLTVEVAGSDEASLMDTYDFSYELPLSLELDGDPVDGNAFLAAHVKPGNPPVDPETLDHHVAAIPVPITSVDTAVLTWDGPATDTTLELDDTVRSRLATAPRFEIRRFETPVLDDGSIAIDFEVENVGDREGRWLAQVSRAAAEDISDVFGFTVPAGSRIERTVRPPILDGAAIEGTVTVQFWSSSDYERDVDVERTDTAS